MGPLIFSGFPPPKNRKKGRISLELWKRVTAGEKLHVAIKAKLGGAMPFRSASKWEH